MPLERNLPDDGPLEQAAALIRQKRDNLLAEARDLEEALNRLSLSTPHAVQSSRTATVEKGQYKLVKPPDALRDYMTRRAGQRITLHQIVSDFMVAEVNPGKGHGQNQTPQEKLTQRVKQALVQPNRTDRLYEYTPPGRLTNIDARDVTVWLAENVEELPKKRRK